MTDGLAASPPTDGRSPSGGPGFAHASEAEMARILDFYAVRWEYEPHVFPILWNLDGRVIESFTPDFWLPDLDLYLEITTLRQRLVRRKNRKLRRLRELYPDVRIKLFYARDFRALMLKYGKLALAEALSGTPGQVVRPPGQEARLPGEESRLPGEESRLPGQESGLPVPGRPESPAEPVLAAIPGAAGEAAAFPAPPTASPDAPPIAPAAAPLAADVLPVAALPAPAARRRRRGASADRREREGHR